MIIVKLIGGLGNQMFQYATGKALANRHGVELKLDISSFKQQLGEVITPRHFELDVFNCDIKFATEEEILEFEVLKSSRWKRILQRKMPNMFSKIYFSESGHLYHSVFNTLPKHVYLEGYWQNENYFKNIRSTLLKDFQIRQTMPTEVNKWLSKIKEAHSVAIHVRRGDYVNLSSANAFHGLCSLDYYESSVEHLQEQLKDLELFVFSDDLDWCKANLKFAQKINFVELKQLACWELFLMSQCQHNIIANSSFSWWAAWLNQTSNKNVCVPQNWFVNTPSSSIDIVAENWTVIE